MEEELNVEERISAEIERVVMGGTSPSAHMFRVRERCKLGKGRGQV